MRNNKIKTKTLTPEQLEELKKIRERLIVLQQRSDERLAMLENMYVDK